MRQVDRAGHARAGGKSLPRLFAADRRPGRASLVANVSVQMPSEAEHHAQDVLGDHVGEQTSHVGELARMLDQLGKQIVLQTGRG